MLCSNTITFENFYAVTQNFVLSANRRNFFRDARNVDFSYGVAKLLSDTRNVKCTGLQGGI